MTVTAAARNSSHTTATTPAEQPVAGILWMLLTMFLFLSMDAVAKQLTHYYPVLLVVWARFFFHMLWLLLFLRTSLKRYWHSNNIRLQLLRSCLLVTTTLLFFKALSMTPLATATAIMFLSPILVTVLSIPLLNERVGIRRWLGVLAGFTGALIIVRPESGSVAVGHLLVVCAALTNALYQLMTRKARLYDSQQTSLLYSALVGAIACSMLVPTVWVEPAPIAWIGLAVIGLIGCISHFCLIRAFQSAPAAVVTPFSYSGLVWATLFGYLIFQQLPDRWTLLGAMIIVASGLYIFYREQHQSSA